MSTARGASAARRDGDDAAPRTTDRLRRPRARAVSGVCCAAAVSVSVALAAAACASAPAPGGDVHGALLPGNQDTAAAAGNLPATPPAAVRPPHAAAAAQAPVTPPTSTASPGKYGTDPLAAAQKMAADLITANTHPTAELTPLQGTSGPTTATTTLPPLEVITMPMWLWVDSPGSLVVKVTQTNGEEIYVVDTVVIDEVRWFLDGSTTPWMTCGSQTQPIAPTPTTANPPSSGPGVAYTSGMDPANAHDDQPLACVDQGFAEPYYQPETVSGVPTTVDGVHTVQAGVFWHVEYEYYDTSGYPVLDGYGPASAVNTVPVMSANTPAFRVGEIQALVTQP